MLGKLNRTQIDNLIYSQVVARIGCSAENKVYVVPITYAYDGKYIYGHTIEGMKTQMMRHNPEVCVEVDDIVNMANWQSAIVWGTYEELQGREADEVLQTLVNRIHPLMSSDTVRPVHGLEKAHSTFKPNTRMVVFRIEVKEATGRFEKK